MQRKDIEDLSVKADVLGCKTVPHFWPTIYIGWMVGMGCGVTQII
jgi:hypothetical protein